jgi:hypothetical protein
MWRFVEIDYDDNDKIRFILYARFNSYSIV